MKPATIAEKIVSQHAGRKLTAGDLAIVNVDLAVASDTTAPLAIKAFSSMGKRLKNPEKVVFVIDHAAPAPTEEIANLHRLMRQFAKKNGCLLHDIGSGIIHHVILENGYCRSGDLVLGADSHTVTYGAWNVFAVGVGSTDLAATMLTGKTWMRVPMTRRIVLDGQPSRGVTAKDVILFLLRDLGLSNCNYQALEFTGSYTTRLPLAGRLTLANMVAELGGKAGLVDPEGLDLGPLEGKIVQSDPGAKYVAEHHIDVASIPCQIAKPGSPASAINLQDLEKIPIDMAFIGTCTNSRLEDLREVAKVLEGQSVAPGVRMLLAPASHQILKQATEDGTLATILSAGVTLMTPGCGPCVGTHMGVPGNEEVVISSGNRNFAGRMGNAYAKVYLASPTTVAASAIKGYISAAEARIAHES